MMTPEREMIEGFKIAASAGLLVAVVAIALVLSTGMGG